MSFNEEEQTRINRTSAGRINRREQIEIEEPKTWWHASRRQVLIGGAAAAAVTLAGGGMYLALRDDTNEIDKDSLDLQREQGWNVGSEEKPINLAGAQMFDSQGGTGWHEYLDPNRLLAAYQPATDAWLPFFVPTLIQGLQYDSLRSQLQPIMTPDMRESYGRGQAIGNDLLANLENSSESALVIDIAGRDAIALGAGLADRARLVTTFDNYPHPLGVTASHETLAAMLTYAAEIEAKQQALPANAPVAFLLDSNRLAPYADADSQFDNRYLAKIPSAPKLQERGVKSVIYVTPDRNRTEELDDLNDDFVEYRNANLNVAMLPLSDFTPNTDTASNNVGGGGGSIDNPPNGNSNEGRYYYGGSPLSPFLFFYAYPFFAPSMGYRSRYGGYSNSTVGRGAALPRTVTPPRYTPAPRPTMFSAARIGGARTSGVGRAKPSGFGRATVRVAPSGSVLGTRAGRSGYYSPSRSGSFGRTGGSVGG